ncbi:MAG: hypothetical protein CME63_10040 [Halobacteriovoraceae bacterium]|nr:hypothetical protein [Halobacteriovoraceae bacterium]|tara:strand:- start:76801 stop:77784 length:984 start_codon:yes stop_codon:yes gene_type:complete
MKVLVTGASGFVGGHLCTALTKAGHQVFGLVRTPKNTKYDFQVVQGDLSVKSLEKTISQLPEDLDAVIHTAGIVHSFDKEIFDKINFKGTQDLEKILRKRYPKLHFIFTSSLAAVGPSKMNEPHTESTPLDPPSLYGQSKKKAEEYLKADLPDDWKLTIVRPPMVIGPKDPAILDVFKMVKSRIILGTGISGMEKQYSFVCVHDLVEVLLRTLNPSDQKIRTYFPSYPKVVTFKEIIEAIKLEMKVRTITLPIPMFIIGTIAHTMALIRKVVPLDFRLTPDKIHELAPKYWCVSSDLSVKELDMKYTWNLQETIHITYEDYTTRGWI